MAKRLPFSRTILATLTRADNSGTRRGFGTALFLAAAAPLVTGQLTKIYGSMEEIAADFAPSTTVYAAAEQAFSLRIRPVRIKIGFTGADDETTVAAGKTILNDILEYDPDFYFLSIDKSLRDTDFAQAVIEWTEPQERLAWIDTNNILHEDVADTTNISATNKDKYKRSATFYHEHVDEYPGFVAAARQSTFNFDEANSAYTMKYKELGRLTPTEIGVAGVTAATGFVEQMGMDDVAGHCANMYVDIGGYNVVVEGSTLTPNTFVDEIHVTDWIIARSQEETMRILATNNRIPFTDTGMQTLASAVRVVMQQAVRAGIIAEDLNPLTGVYEPAIEYVIPSVFSVPESQRARRIAPELAVTFRYAGAVHYVTIRFNMTF